VDAYYEYALSGVPSLPVPGPFAARLFLLPILPGQINSREASEGEYERFMNENPPKETFQLAAIIRKDDV